MDDAHASPVWWHALASDGVAIRGPEPARLGIWLDRSQLSDWCRDNLRSYWAMWTRRAADPTDELARALATDWGAAWCVLGVLRLRYTIETGKITSKSGAGRYGLDTMGEGWRPLISEALSLRGVPPPTPTDPAPETSAAVARRDAVVEFMRTVIDSARAT
jgi:hypothetical protein